jgi:hypothetical protein
MKFAYQLPSALLGAAIVLVQFQQTVALTNREIQDIAKDITVQINNIQINDEERHGSGVIFEREDKSDRTKIYSVLTARHIVIENAKYEIRTPDGKVYPVDSTQLLPDNSDLIVLQFKSQEIYSIGFLSKSEQLSLSSKIYVAGWDDGLAVSNERTFYFTSGQLTSRIDSSKAQQGYTLLYDNTTVGGTSGGPILDEEGRVVGIHGQVGEKVDNQTGRFFSLGIPIEIFIALRDDLKPIEESSILSEVTDLEIGNVDEAIEVATTIESEIKENQQKRNLEITDETLPPTQPEEGLAVAQSHFLMLTARKSDLEFQGQTINQERMILANMIGQLYNLQLNLSSDDPQSREIVTKIQTLQRLDKTLELRLKQIDTQHEIVQIEIDAVKKFIDDNIRRTFKTFGYL